MIAINIHEVAVPPWATETVLSLLAGGWWGQGITRAFTHHMMKKKRKKIRMLKSANFTFLRFAVLNPWLSVSSFHPLFVVWFCFFVQLVKCLYSRVWELTMGSTPLDKRPKSTKLSVWGCFSIAILETVILCANKWLISKRIISVC